MERIDFYKMSIEEYPNHKDKNSLIFSVTELQKELDASYKYIDYLEDNEGEDEKKPVNENCLPSTRSTFALRDISKSLSFNRFKKASIAHGLARPRFHWQT